MKFEFDIEEKKNDRIEITVYSPTIRGAQWTVTRVPGTGTYASIAGHGLDDDDEHIVIEEWNDPERRALWDDTDNLDAVEAAYEEIMREIEGDEGEA